MPTSESLAAPSTALQPPPRTRRKRGIAPRPAMLYRAWPRPLTGCVSALSVCRGRTAAYQAALKQYGALCTAAEWPADAAAPHDYEALANPAPPGPGCGCLTAELAEIPAPTAAIGDDDIEFCGYLGWLRR